MFEAKANFNTCTARRRVMIKIICLEEIVGFSFFENSTISNTSLNLNSELIFSLILEGNFLYFSFDFLSPFL